MDVSRTFPSLGLFQTNGPFHDLLINILSAYVVYRPDISYVQGMSFLAAMFLLNMETCDSFICFANMLDNSQMFMTFFNVNQAEMKSYYITYETFLKENLPKLYIHFVNEGMSPDLYLVDWIYTLFSRSLDLDVCSRVWDLFMRDGDEFIFRSAIGILYMYQDLLLQMDFINLAQFLTKLPPSILSTELFRCISCIKMSVRKGANKQSFQAVLQSNLSKSVVIEFIDNSTDPINTHDNNLNKTS